MFSIFRVLGVFFSFGPRMTALIAAVFATIAVLLTLNSIKDARIADELIAKGPPQAVNVDDFDADLHKTDLLEVHIIGQIDVRHTYEYSEERKNRITRKTLIPILEVSNPLGRPLAMVELDATDSAFSAFQGLMISDGTIGPIVQVNGKSVYSGSYSSEAKKALTRDFGFYSPKMLYVRPFFGDRAERLKGGGISSFFGEIFGILAVLFVVMAFVKSRRNKPDQAMKSQPKTKSNSSDGANEDSVVKRN